MKKKYRWFIALWSLMAVLAAIFIVGCAPRIRIESEPVYVREYDINLWKDTLDGFFKEPFEILVLCFWDGWCMAVTTHEERRVDVDAHSLKRMVERRGRKLQEAALVVHNHPKPTPPSFGNKIFTRKLRRLGFRGIAGVYYPHSGEFKPIK